MAKSKKKIIEESPAVESSSEPENVLQQHLQEPLFLTAVVGFLFTLFMLYGGGGFAIDNGPIILGVLFLASLYFLNLHLKAKTRNKLLYGIPVLLFVAFWFSMMLTRYMEQGLGRDYLVFTVIAGLFLFFYALASHRILKLSTALVLALFFCTLLTHFIPALEPYLAEIDPHWHFKWAQELVSTGHIPDFDYLTYPMKGGITYYGSGVDLGRDFAVKYYFNESSKSYPAGLDLSTQRFFPVLFMGSMQTALSVLGLSIEDAAMLYPLVIGAFAIVMFYLLLRYLFEDMKPYNEVVALLGAFMLFMSPAFATKAAAGNCEDDIMWMFLLLSSGAFIALAYQRKSLLISVVSGISMLMLALSGGSYSYLVLVLGLAMGLQALASFLNNEYCLKMTPYALIAYLISALYPFFLHGKVGGLDFPSLRDYTIMVFFGSIAFSFVLEFLRSRQHGILLQEGQTFFDRLQNALEKNINLLGPAVSIVIVVGFFLMGPSAIIESLIGNILGAKVHDVVGMTIAEQNPFASDVSGYFNEGYLRYGVALLFGVFLMIPLLGYLVFTKSSFGPAFVLCWSLPMIWGVFNKSQYLFNSSTPIVALGASIGLFAALKKEDWNSFRVIPTLLIILVPLLYMPFAAGSMYAKFVGIRTLYVTMTDEMYLWRPSLDWLAENTKPSEAAITWWDYGHWITSISHRPVLIDNLQVDPYEIQDVARFFMLKRDPEDAMNTIRAYNKRYEEIGMNLTHAVIDWTMIGKGSALHFIATGVIENGTSGSFMNFAQCSFLEKQSSQQKIVNDKNGKPAVARTLVFSCPWPVAGILFDVIGDEISAVNVAVPDSYGSYYTIPWATWVKDNPASILGIHPLSEVMVLGLQRPDLLGSPYATWRDNSSTLHSSQTYSLVYVPGEFNDYMMTRLYLGDYVDYVPSEGCFSEENKNKVYCASYLNQGLFTGNITQFRPEYFKLAGDFSGGYVRIYDIVYNKS